MKKILIGIVIVLLCVMAYFAIFRGLPIGSMRILSVEQIQDENNKLTQEIAETETLMHSTYASKTAELDKNVSSLLNAKEEYYDLAEVSTEKELNEANKEETYRIEYLWAKIGSYATKEGVLLKLDVLTGETGESNVKNLSFNLEGNYIAILNFITDIEDDSGLGFKIENFKILPGTGSDGRSGTFTVRNVRIKQENTSVNITNTVQNTDNTTTDQTDNNTTDDVVEPQQTTGTDPMGE